MSARVRSLVAVLALAACAEGSEPTATGPDAMVPVVDAKVAVDVSDDEVAVLDDVIDVVDASNLVDVIDASAVSDVSEATVDVFDAPDEIAEASVDAPVDASPRPDAGVLGDSLPMGAVMYFTASACPAGWVSYDAAVGRVAVPTTGAAAGGEMRGLPLRSGEERAHTHRVASGFDLGGVSYVGIVGGGNGGVGAAGRVTFATDTAPVSAGLPYVQLLVCRKTAAAVTRTLALPAGMRMFFAGDRCPSGFSQAPGTQGRLPVGLPEGGTNGATFGGTPLGMVDAPTHTHSANVAVTTTPHGIALASGCCGSGYARDGMYTATATTGAAEAEVPTLTLLQCMKD